MDEIKDEVLDNALRLETPEGTEVELHPAGITVRALAFLIDELIRWTIIIVVFMVAGLTGMFGMGLALLVLFVVYWLYGVVFEVLNNGQTPGKKLYALQVVHDDGTPIRFPASVLRNLLLAVDLLPFLYVFGFISMAVSDRFRRIGDLVGGTMVVFRRSLHRPAQDEDNQGSRPAPLPLTVEEQSMLLAYLDRKRRLSTGRVDELSSILAPLLDCRSENATQEVTRLANGVRGVDA